MTSTKPKCTEAEELSAAAPAAATATLYYDGACPLCTREMDKLGPMAEGLTLTDVHTLPESEEGPSRRELLENLHYQSPDGELLVGLEANVAAWQHTRHAWAWRLLLLPVIRQFAEIGYRLWARWRYRRLYG
ncbi:MAG: DUF393 domain-containing protein [Pseudomonadota bacterium]